MSSRTYALASIAGIVLLVASVVAFATGVGPAPGGNGDDIEEFPTETPAATEGSTAATATSTASGGDSTTTDGGGVVGSTTTATATATATPEPAFATEVERIENCGRTCRDVTGTVSNDGDADATGVTVYTRIFVGNGTDGDVVWEGKREVGDLPAGASVTETQRVELSYTEALAIRNAGGWITVQTTVQSEETTVTATERRKVA